MSALTDSPSKIVRQLLIDLSLGSDGGASWPVFSSNEPDSPDSCITVYDTTGSVEGRLMHPGEFVEHQGIQIRVRSMTYEIGSKKARDIVNAIDQLVYRRGVTVGSCAYTVHAINRSGAINSLGREVGVSNRRLFTVNATIDLWQDI